MSNDDDTVGIIGPCPICGDCMTVCRCGNTKDKAREFWIEQFNGRIPATLKAFNEKPVFSNVELSRNASRFPACEYFHVIEKSALTAAEDRIARLEKALLMARDEIMGCGGHRDLTSITEIDSALKGSHETKEG